MATPNIVPRSDSEGGLGTASKYWASAYIDLIYVGAGKMGRDADNLFDFSIDNEVTFRVNATDEMVLNDSSLSPHANRGLSLGTSALRWKDLHLGDAAVINFNNGNVVLTHSNNHLTLADNDILGFGNASDLSIKHTDTAGYIQNVKGHLYINQIADDKDIIFQSDDGSGSYVPYLTLDGSVAKVQFDKPALFLDSKSAEFGTDTDMIMYHSGSTGYIENYTGNFKLIQQVDDGDIIFMSDDGSGGVTEYLRFDGGDVKTYVSKDMKFNDSVYATFGNNDLLIGHDGTNSRIYNYTGNLQITNLTDDADIVFQCDDGAGGFTTYFYLDGSSATHDGSTTTALYTNWPDKSRITLGTSHDIYMYHDGANTWFENQTGDLTFRNSANDKDIIFQSDNGSGGVAEYFKLDGSANSGGLPVTVFPDNSLLWIGTDGGGMRFHADGNNSEIQNHVGNLTIVNNTDNGSIIFKNDDGSGGTTTYFYLDGALSTPHTRFPDSSILVFGTGADLAINHNGTNSLIENYTGDLYIKNNADDGDIIFQNDDGSGGIETYFYLDGSANNSGQPYTIWPDSSIASWGTGADLRINHDGTHSYIYNSTGDLFIINYADDKDIVFQSDDGSGGVTEYFRLDGDEGRLVHTANSRYLDNATVMIGSGADLQIYHDGSNSYITQSGTGHLQIRQTQDDKDIKFECDDGAGGTATYFFLDGSLATHDGSANTGLFTNWPDNSQVTLGSSRDLRLYHTGTDSIIEQSGTGHLYIRNSADDNDIVFSGDNGSGGVMNYFAVDGSITRTNFYVNTLFNDNVEAAFGSNIDMKIYHDATNSYIMNETGQLYILNKSDDKDIELQSDDGSGNLTTYIQLDGSEVSTKILTQKVIMSNLPTSDPSNAGQLWNDSGTLKISAG